jgi:hypothetical protein
LPPLPPSSSVNPGWEPPFRSNINCSRSSLPDVRAILQHQEEAAAGDAEADVPGDQQLGVGGTPATPSRPSAHPGGPTRRRQPRLRHAVALRRRQEEPEGEGPRSGRPPGAGREAGPAAHHEPPGRPLPRPDADAAVGQGA